MKTTEYSMLKASKYVFITMMGVGYLMRPELVRPRQNYGVSNFWFKKRSRIPYVAGFAINTLGTIYVANKIFKNGNRRVAGGLAAKSATMAAVLFTSKLLGTKRSQLHYAAGGLMYAVQVLFSGWLILRKTNFKNLGLFAVELLGTTLNLLTAAEKLQQMFVGQVLAQFGYISLLLRNLRPNGGARL